MWVLSWSLSSQVVAMLGPSAQSKPAACENVLLAVEQQNATYKAVTLSQSNR